MIRLWRLVALPVLLGFVLLATYLFFYLGYYKPVEVTMVESAGLNTLFRSHRGAYHLINQVIVEVENWAKSQGLSCERTYGEYLDDPQKVEQGRLRSRAGCILDGPVDEKSLPEGFQAGLIPAGPYVQAVFSGSPAIGPWKVYPRLADFIQEKNLKTGSQTIEIYTIKADGKMQTQYLIPILP